MVALSFAFRRGFQFVVCLLALIWMGICPYQAEAASSSSDSAIRIFVDTEELELDVPPKVKNGTTLVPFRSLFEALDMEVTWDSSQRSITGTNTDQTLTLVIGAHEAVVNNTTFPLIEAAEIVNGRALIPLRFVGEASGASVFWDPYNREISVVTLKYMGANNISKEQLEQAIEDYLKERAAEEVNQDSEPDTSEMPAQPIKPVNLDSLEGMYYGFRSDFGGYECGGICWDFYTFLPDKEIFIGLPASGGPETIDCSKETCLTYSIKDGKLKLSNGESLNISKSEKGFLIINGVQLDVVQPVSEETTFDHEYIYIGYSGLAGISGASHSWTYTLSLRSDGTFEMSGVTVGTTGIDPKTNVGISDDADTGTYDIQDNTITLTSNDGTVTHALFFIHNSNPEGSLDDIQLGATNYYVPQE